MNYQCSEEKIVYFYIKENLFNDATIYYVELVKQAFNIAGYEVITIGRLIKSLSPQYIFTITPGCAYRAAKVFPKAKFITWFQGIGPEEYQMLHGRSIRSFVVKKICELWERSALKKVNISIFVSMKMKEHYLEKYGFDVKNFFIMPCYNKYLNVSLIDANKLKYNSLTFVYAGGLFSWQCIDETLEVFKNIELQNPDAKLTLLTKDISIANSLFAKYNIKNAVAKYVQLRDLDKELALYKYGFLLRHDVIVNNVATPTKMNSYLAAGVIPIYTNVVDSFNSNISLDNYEVKINSLSDKVLIANKILKHHLEFKVNTDVFKKKLINIFNSYYSDEKYINELSKLFINLDMYNVV